MGSACEVSIKFLPDEMLKKLAPKKKVEKLLSGKVTVKKAALSFLDDATFIDKASVLDVALKVAKNYKERIKTAKVDDSQTAADDLKTELVDDPKLMVQRVQNEIVFQVHDGIKKTYGGRMAVWLPSDADEPRPEHQLNYGMEYEIGVGIDGVEPGDEYGCRCGVEIKGSETELELE